AEPLHGLVHDAGHLLGLRVFAGVEQRRSGTLVVDLLLERPSRLLSAGAEDDLAPGFGEDADAPLADAFACAGDEDDLVPEGHEGRAWPSSRWSRRRRSGTSFSSASASRVRSSRVSDGNARMPTFSSVWRTRGWTFDQTERRSSTRSRTRSSRA